MEDTKLMRLDRKVIIVTGAARGIGKAYAKALAKEGAHVVVSDILGDLAKATAAEITSAGGTALAVRSDISIESEANKLAEETYNNFGKIDVLVNNAAKYAGLKRRPFYEIDVNEWDQVQSVNLKGTFLCIKAVFPYMKDHGGKVVNISSATFYAGSPGLAHYVASKAGVIGLTRALSKELGQYNITINAIAPGFTITEANLDMNPDPKYKVEMANARALKRDEYPDDLVGTMLYLCSGDSDFMTGQTLVIDGGRSLH